MESRDICDKGAPVTTKSGMVSLEPRLSVPDFVLQLWRNLRFFSKAARENPELKAWVRGYTYVSSPQLTVGSVLVPSVDMT